jgi:hypothetical protein
MGFFDFIAELPYYHDHTALIQRMNMRHDALIALFSSEISGARVLDLASHVGR